MTETQRAPEGFRPRIKPVEAGDDRPVSISARLGRLQFHASGKFRVLQVADIQDGPKVSKDTVRLIAASIDATRPDLVVFSGNQIAGFDSAFADTFRKRRWSEDTAASASALEKTRELVRKAIGQFVAPLEARKVPWAVTYGNHDFQCGLSNAELDSIYREFPGCINAADTLLPDQTIYACEPGTLALPVKDVEGQRNVLGLVILDSGDYAHGGGFGVPSEKAFDFLRRVPGLLNNQDGDVVRSMVFQHMPLPEYYQVLQSVPSNTAYAMQGYRDHADTYYILDEQHTQLGGYLGEGISCPDQSDEFAILRDSGGYFAVAAGHDHRNGFVGEYEGITVIATPTCGFNTYGPAPAKRATRLIEFDIRHPYEPRTQLLEFGELVGKPSSKQAYTYAVNQATPGEGEGDDLLRKPSLWSQLTGLFK
ncbi:metallophosphoesterase family protein [Bifidobacterium sp. LC6]|uniref:Metallophosphoesterase family protein n=1 Tax=Bifidobacterium colobi TaxID=2809026 RepID=A0ABS5UX78_9BIFI|nr:metallophosphoesterase family protein [Bifidobacterium colobi]MBT1175675.1 metallophosphoesterase family protein [Bifidobacterium colobi]